MSVYELGVILSAAVVQAERRIWRGANTRLVRCTRDPSPNGEGAGLRDDAVDLEMTLVAENGVG